MSDPNVVPNPMRNPWKDFKNRVLDFIGLEDRDERGIEIDITDQTRFVKTDRAGWAVYEKTGKKLLLVAVRMNPASELTHLVPIAAVLYDTGDDSLTLLFQSKV